MMMNNHHRDIVLEIINHFNLDLTEQNNSFYGCCPVHQGDNNNAFRIYINPTNVIWQCYTFGCHRYFGKDLLGLIHGLLSKNEDWTINNSVTQQQAYEFLNRFSIKERTINEEFNSFIKTINILVNNNSNNFHSMNLTRELLEKKLKIPSPYFLSRGFKEDTLKKFGIGDNLERERAVVPIFAHNNHNIIGLSARYTKFICPLCHQHHNRPPCPMDAKDRINKWVHTKGLSSKKILYNYYNAKDSIKQENSLVLVESPANTWKLYEAGIPYVMAIFGANLSIHQLNLIHKLPVRNLFVLMDNDEAGKNCAEEIVKRCENLYNTTIINIEKNDVAEMSIQEIQDIIYPQINYDKDISPIW